jgi:fatty-acyl-CoA synthase
MLYKRDAVQGLEPLRRGEWDAIQGGRALAEVVSSSNAQSAVAGAPGGDLSYIEGAAAYELRRDTVSGALVRLANESPDRPAVLWATEHGAQQLSWAELCHRARCGAAALLELNPDRTRVAIAAMNSINWVVAMYACALAGMSVVPISASGTDDEARYQIEHADVGLILAARTAGKHRVLNRLSALATSLSTTLRVHDIAELGTAQPADRIAVSPEDEFLIQYTSGTTGRPKAASISHGAALNCGTVFMRAVGCGADDRLLNPLPLHHVGGSVTGVISTLAIGGAYVMVERFSPQGVLDALRHTRPTIAGLVPTMMIDLLALPGVTPTDFTSLRAVIGGATAVDPGLIAEMEQRLGVTVIGSYGQSEAPAMIAASLADSAEVRTQALGRCLVGRDFKIRDRDGATAPIGAVGELCVRGPLTMTGYLRSDGGLDPATDSDGWRATGDLCEMDADGVITFRGRIREVVIRGGLNVYPTEVEQAVSSLESVAEVAVFGSADPRLGERVVAAVIPAAGSALDVTELDALAERRLSSYKRPTEWVAVADFPRTSTGKVRKHLLREWHQAGTLEAECGVMPTP